MIIVNISTEKSITLLNVTEELIIDTAIETNYSNIKNGDYVFWCHSKEEMKLVESIQAFPIFNSVEIIKSF